MEIYSFVIVTKYQTLHWYKLNINHIICYQTMNIIFCTLLHHYFKFHVQNNYHTDYIVIINVFQPHKLNLES